MASLRYVNMTQDALLVMEFGMKFATIRAKNALKLLVKVACDKQKTILVCFLSGNITLVVVLANGNPLDQGSRGFTEPRQPLV